MKNNTSEVVDFKKPAKLNGAYVENLAYSIYTDNYISSFYREQLSKFKKIGLGNQTEYGIEVTMRLIECTRRRLQELQPAILRIKDKKWRV